MDRTNLLTSEKALALYDTVRDLPIVDYHNHLSLSDLAQNRRYTDVFELWIQPDPYKHRAMRMCGVPEREITGDAGSEDKFLRWCETLPKLWGNPLYAWSLAELRTVFGIDTFPDAGSGKELYRQCNAYLLENVVTPAELLRRFRVELACPCASLTDDIGVFESVEGIAPSLRGDDLLGPTPETIQKLEQLTGLTITDKESYRRAVAKRLDDFERCGLVFADHALDNGFRFGEDERSSMLLFLGEEYARRGIVMQLHLGAQRTTSTRLRAAAGAAGGYAAIGNSVDAASLACFLDALDRTPHGLPRIVLFPLNPADNALIASLSGSFSKDGVAGLITPGPAWWWCDHRHGIVDVLENTAAFGVLSNFTGMTTDSRSLLSFVRHDYFRRVLCDWIAEKTEKEPWIDSAEHLNGFLYDLCYGNAKRILQQTL